MAPRAELDPVLLTFVSHLDLKKEVSVLLRRYSSRTPNVYFEPGGKIGYKYLQC